MTTQLALDRLALPPPLDLTLVDADRTTGWIADNAVGFRGFGDETAYRLQAVRWLLSSST